MFGDVFQQFYGLKASTPHYLAEWMLYSLGEWMLYSLGE